MKEKIYSTYSCDVVIRDLILSPILPGWAPFFPSWTIIYPQYSIYISSLSALIYRFFF